MREPAPEVIQSGTPPQGAARRPDLSPLTGLRFLAATAVVLFHLPRLRVPPWATPLRSLQSSGFVAVSLFFLLSGFILAYTYLTPDGSLRGSRHNFWVSRFARIYPAYLLAFLLAAPFVILNSLHFNGLRVAVEKLGVSGLLFLTMQQAWTPWTAATWNYPAWSVSVEAFFYLSFPWIGPRLTRVRSLAVPAWALVLWLLSMLPAALFIWSRRHGSWLPDDPLPTSIQFTPLLRLPEFMLGILLGRAFTAGNFAPLRGRVRPWMAVLPILIVLSCTPFIPHPLLASGMIAPLFALLLVTLAQDRGPLARLLAHPWLKLLGEASYGIYILQVPVALLMGIPAHSHSWARNALYVVALTAVALFSFHFIESPARLRLKAIFGEPADLERPQPPVTQASAFEAGERMTTGPLH